MRTVPRNPAIELAPGARARAGAYAAGAVAAGVVVLVAGGSGSGAAPAIGQVLIAGKPLQSANCESWWAGTAAERAATVKALHASVAGTGPHGPAATLSSGRAFRMFDRVCAPTFAGHFLLYEMYIRAAAFQPLGPGG